MLIYLYNVNIVKIHVMVFPWSVTYMICNVNFRRILGEMEIYNLILGDFRRF